MANDLSHTTLDFPSLQEQKQYWDARWDRTKMPNDWALRRAEEILDLLHAVPCKDGNILDLGCGTGWFAEKLSRLGRVTGIDLSEGAIAAAKVRYPDIQFTAGNLFDMTLATETFDLVVCQEVIAHVPDQQRLLNRIADVMKPGGYLAITTVNKFVIDRVNCGPDPREHIKQWLTMKDFKQLLSHHFRVLRTTTVLPMGDRGILRLLNASKIEALCNHLFGVKRIERLKERAGFGYTMVALAQKQ